MALNEAKNFGDELFIIGGATLYEIAFTALHNAFI